jgi:hypothetical protein
VSEAGVSEAQARVSDIEEMKASVREEEEEEANIYVLFFFFFSGGGGGGEAARTAAGDHTGAVGAAGVAERC